MTHIFEDIRQDSIKFLNCWLQIEPLLAIKFMDQVNHYNYSIPYILMNILIDFT